MAKLQIIVYYYNNNIVNITTGCTTGTIMTVMKVGDYTAPSAPS